MGLNTWWVTPTPSLAAAACSIQYIKAASIINDAVCLRLTFVQMNLLLALFWGTPLFSCHVRREILPAAEN